MLLKRSAYIREIRGQNLRPLCLEPERSGGGADEYGWLVFEKEEDYPRITRIFADKWRFDKPEVLKKIRGQCLRLTGSKL